jgi:hypothetical protein
MRGAKDKRSKHRVDNRTVPFPFGGRWNGSEQHIRQQ